MRWLTQLRYQVKFDLTMFRRDPASTFFTVIFPLIFLFLFTSIFGNEETAGGVRLATFYVPGILALSIVSATMVNEAITMVSRRERGMLKRVRGTPLRPWVFVLSQGWPGWPSAYSPRSWSLPSVGSCSTYRSTASGSAPCSSPW